MTNEERLTEIRARCEAATEGPWKSRGRHFRTGNYCVNDNHDLRVCGLSISRTEDADFIAHAREDVPWLLEMLADARKVGDS